MTKAGKEHETRGRDDRAGTYWQGTRRRSWEEDEWDEWHQGWCRVPYFAPEGSRVCGELSKGNIETEEYTRAACSRRALSCAKYSEPAGALVASGRALRATARREERARRDMFGSSRTTRVASGRVEDWISDRLRLKDTGGGDASHRYT